jgi:hypothetical protein
LARTRSVGNFAPAGILPFPIAFTIKWRTALSLANVRVFRVPMPNG